VFSDGEGTLRGKLFVARFKEDAFEAYLQRPIVPIEDNFQTLSFFERQVYHELLASRNLEAQLLQLSALMDALHHKLSAIQAFELSPWIGLAKSLVRLLLLSGYHLAAAVFANPHRSIVIASGYREA
jgi:hypothetical protein